MNAHDFLKALTVVLCTAGLTSVLFQRLRQPVVLGYIMAGLIVGPYVPIPLVADPAIVQTLSEIGVILLMFSLGLEFNLSKLVAVGPTAALTAIIQSSIMVWLGYLVGQAMGWSIRESIFAGAIIAISSTTIIAKVFDEQKIGGRLREIVVGILIVEDLIAILLMAILTALSTGQGLSLGVFGESIGKLGAFLAVLLILGMLLVPRLAHAIVALDRPETTLVASIGFCFAIALLAHSFGYSVALGAFIAGSLIAESGEEQTVEHLVLPVRDVFAAIFFVSVGMMINPALIVQHWQAIVLLTIVVVVGKVFGVALGAFLTGNGIRTSIQAGMSLAQIGEFSFIMAGLGLSLGATGDFMYPVAVAVSALTTFSTPWLIRAADPVAAAVDRSLPKPLQTFATLYGSWLDKLQRQPVESSVAQSLRRLIKRLLLDAAILTAILIGLAIGAPTAAAWLSERLDIQGSFSYAVVVVGGFTLLTPFVVGLVRVARRLGELLANAALPEATAGQLDLAAAPRRMLIVTLQLTAVLLVGLPVLALTQPFLPRWASGPGFIVLLTGLGYMFWQSANNLQGHVRAGAEVVMQTLLAQARKNTGARDETLTELKRVLPGLGDPTPVRLSAQAAAVGKTLADLNLRGLTGASVLAIVREGGKPIIPSAGEILRVGDVLAVVGSTEAVSAAQALLQGPAEAR